jgi:hypothetical protein
MRLSQAVQKPLSRAITSIILYQIFSQNSSHIIYRLIFKVLIQLEQKRVKFLTQKKNGKKKVLKASISKSGSRLVKLLIVMESLNY